jgi:hypothetical protein
MAIRFSACTTSGQLWQDSAHVDLEAEVAVQRRICSITSGSTLGGWPPVHSSASTSEVNSWPSGRTGKAQLRGAAGALQGERGLAGVLCRQCAA